MNNFMLLFILIFPMLGSFIGYGIGIKNEKARDNFNIIVTGVNFAAVVLLYGPVSLKPLDISVKYIMGTGLHLRLDVFRYLFVWITSLIWFLTMIYSTRYLIRYKNRNRYYFFFMITMSSTIGVFISENLLNLFTFFEIMSLTSYALIIHDEDDYAHDAGKTYMVMAVAGGLILLMGLFLLYNYTQTLDISFIYPAVKDLGTAKYIISSLIIIGFGVKAGMIPLHIWLPKAHPAAPAPASAVLSGILLKTGIFGIILTIDIMLKGDFIISVIILAIGFLNMLTGGLLATFQRNIKRILAYSSMSQIGYILVGIGLAGVLKDHAASIAIVGTLFHIINHALFKVLLFMGAGVIYMALHELSINKIGGFGINRISLKIFFFIGLLAIIGMPGFNGFASKTLLHEALAEARHLYDTKLLNLAEGIFKLSSSLTVAYLLKLFMAVFVDESKNTFEHVNYKPSKATIIPLSILSALIIGIGINPQMVLSVLNKALWTFSETNHAKVQVFSLYNIKSSISTILLGIFIYFFLVKKFLRKGEGKDWYYINPALNWFDMEKHIYSPVIKLVSYLCHILFKFIDGALVGLAYSIRKFFDAIGEKEVRLLGKIFIYFRASSNKVTEKIINTTGKRTKKQFEFSSGFTGGMEEAILKYEKKFFNIKAMAMHVLEKTNSITTSIFIFISVLVACLLILIVKNSVL